MSDVPANQPMLLEEGSPPVFLQSLEAKGEYTADRLRVQRPEVYQQVVLMLGQRWSFSRVARETGVTRRTARAVCLAEGETIAQRRAVLADLDLDLAHAAVEAAQEIVEEHLANPLKRRELTIADAQRLMIAHGIAVQNSQLLADKPTSTIGIEIFMRGPTNLDAELRASLDAHVRALPMGLGMEKNGANAGGEMVAGAAAGAAAGAPAARREIGLPDGPTIDVESDKQSDVSACKP